MSTNVMVELAKLTAALQSGSIKPDKFNQEVAAMIAAASAAAGAKSLTFKISEKGAVSVYGLNARFPVSLYAEQWERLLGAADELKAFLKANADKLPAKSDRPKQAPAPTAPAAPAAPAALPAGIDVSQLAALLAQAK